MKKTGRILKYSALMIIVAGIACSPVRTRKSTPAKDAAPKVTKTKESAAAKNTARKTGDEKEKVKSRFSDTTVIYLSNPPE